MPMALHATRACPCNFLFLQQPALTRAVLGSSGRAGAGKDAPIEQTRPRGTAFRSGLQEGNIS